MKDPCKLYAFRFNVVLISTAQFIFWPIAYIFFKVFLSYKIEGIENIKKALALAKTRKAGTIFASNHVSEFDGILLTMGVAPQSFFSPMFQISMPAKEFKDKHFKWRRFLYSEAFLRIWGAYTFRRGLKNYEDALCRHVQILQRGHRITIHPDGRIRTSTTDTPKTHGGLAFLAHRTNSVIVPVAILGITTMTAKELFSRKRKLVVQYLEPIVSENILNLDIPNPYKEATRKVTRIYDSVANNV